jgi:hypothetical protein
VASRCPTLLFILAEDMEASNPEHMPKMQRILANQGLKFTIPYQDAAL